MKVDLSLFDITRKRRIIKKWYRDNLSNWRSIAHRFANEIYERFTGDKGIFNTEIAFVSRRSIKHRGAIYIMDWDGTNLRSVTKNRMGNNAPSWSPDGRWLAFSYLKTNPPGVFFNTYKWRKAEASEFFKSPSDWRIFFACKPY